MIDKVVQNFGAHIVYSVMHVKNIQWKYRFLIKTLEKFLNQIQKSSKKSENKKNKKISLIYNILYITMTKSVIIQFYS